MNWRIGQGGNVSIELPGFDTAERASAPGLRFSGKFPESQSG